MIKVSLQGINPSELEAADAEDWDEAIAKVVVHLMEHLPIGYLLDSSSL